MTTTNTTATGYTVSNATALFVEALRTHQQTKDNFLSALAELYGDTTAEQLYNDQYADRLDALETVLFEGIGLSVRESINDRSSATI